MINGYTFIKTENGREIMFSQRGTISVHDIESSSISSLWYSPSTSKLQVTFKNGTEYGYAGVALGEFFMMMNAESVGSFFAKNIRNKYPTEKLD
jgi:hypothetical protein